MTDANLIYSTFGRVSQTAKFFVDNLGALLIAMNALEGEESPSSAAKDAASYLNSLAKDALGGRLARLKNYSGIDPALIDGLMQALSVRNALVHDFFVKRDQNLKDPSGRSELLLELGEMHFALVSAWGTTHAIARDLAAVLNSRSIRVQPASVWRGTPAAG